MVDVLERKRSIELSFAGRDTWLTVVESTAVSVISIAALIGNVILCLAIYRFRALRKIQNYYIAALAISDLLLTLLCFSAALAVVILGRWPFGETVCQIQGSLIYLLASFMILNMTLIAVNRYVKMVRTANIYHKIYTKNYVLLSIAACGIFSGVFLIPFLSRGFCFHPGKLTCFVCKSTNKDDQAVILSSYSVMMALTYPVMAFCYYKVFRKVRAHFAHVADSTLHENSVQSYAEEVKITKILFAVLIAFLICWTPAFVTEFCDTLRGEYTLQRQVYLIMFYTGAANCAVNPVIYGWMQKRFRDAYKKVITCEK